jgi:hypothetical protein
VDQTIIVRVFSEAQSGAYQLLVGEVVVEGAQVVGRRLFYNNSAFDGDDPASEAAAIAVDKMALLPGQTATFENYTSFVSGINGLMIDLANPSDTVTLEDFLFRVGNDNNPDGWADAPAPSSFQVLRGAGQEGSDRIVLTWEDQAITGTWLQVTVLASERSGLSANDRFYFGNAVGDSGDSDQHARVNATDEIGARNNPHTFDDPAPIDDRYDFDRDGRVNATDEIIARNHATTFLNQLNLITPPASGAVAVRGDFDGDGTLDKEDIDALGRAIAEKSSELRFDLNQDRQVSYGDLMVWIVDLFQSQPGDANLDGAVDAVDFAIWSEHRFQSETGWSRGDFNADGNTDASDLSIWNNQRFTSVAAGSRLQRVPRAALAAAELPIIAPASREAHSVLSDVAFGRQHVTLVATDQALEEWHATNHLPPRRSSWRSASTESARGPRTRVEPRPESEWTEQVDAFLATRYVG